MRKHNLFRHIKKPKKFCEQSLSTLWHTLLVSNNSAETIEKYNSVSKVFVGFLITQISNIIGENISIKRELFSNALPFLFRNCAASLYEWMYVCMYVHMQSFASFSKITAMTVRWRYAHTRRQSPELFCHVTHAVPALPLPHSHRLLKRA